MLAFVGDLGAVSMSLNYEDAHGGLFFVDRKAAGILIISGRGIVTEVFGSAFDVHCTALAPCEDRVRMPSCLLYFAGTPDILEEARGCCC